MEAQEEAAHEEKQHAEEAALKKRKLEEEAATKKKKEHKRCNVECKQEERELAAARARVAKYEVEARERAEAGESLGGSDVSSDNEVRIMGVTSKVSGSGVVVKVS